MPGCRDSEISVFACASACGAKVTRPSSTKTPAQMLRIFLFIKRPPRAPILLTDLRHGTNTLVYLGSRPSSGNSIGHPNELLAGHFTPFAQPIRRPARP